MRRIGIFLFVMFVFLSAQNLCAQSKEDFTLAERQFLDDMKRRGAPEEQINKFKAMIKAKRGDKKEWSEKELKDLDVLLTSKWEEMRRALASGDIETAVSFICKKHRDGYYRRLSKLSRDQLLNMSKDLADIKMIKMQGSHWAEYDIQTVKDGKTYSFILIFEKNPDDVWEIRSF